MNRILRTKGKQFFNLINYSNMTTTSTGIPLKDVVDKLELFAPKVLSEKWDNTGVLIEPFTPRNITSVLLTNDLTEDVMEEAISHNTNLIISYHPPIFSGLKAITNKTWKERLVNRCLENRIAVYSPHTSWDSVKDGVNDWLAKSLPSHTRTFISEGVLPESGQGRLCVLDKSVQLSKIIESIKAFINLEHVQLAIARGCSTDTMISSVALCAGSGASVLKDAKADLYLTGEMSHHDVLDAVHRGTSVILTNHSNSERGFLTEFRIKLKSMLDDKVDVLVSKDDHDPLKSV